MVFQKVRFDTLTTDEIAGQHFAIHAMFFFPSSFLRTKW